MQEKMALESSDNETEEAEEEETSVTVNGTKKKITSAKKGYFDPN